MAILPLALELLLCTFASWTVAYHLILATHRPAYYTLAVWPILAIPLVVFMLRGRGFPRGLGVRRWPAVSLFLLIAAAGAVTLTVHRADCDDLTLFHRVLVQDWRQPFVIGDTVSNFPGLPPQSILHVTTSYEPLVGLVAKIAHLRPLRVYHNAAPFLAAVVMVAIYFLLYRALGLGEWTAVAAVGLVLAFLLIDGNAHGSFGHMALDRLWQGKCIVWTVLVPACLLGAYKFLNGPDLHRFLRLALLGISAVGLSEVGVYTLPILALALALVWIVTSRRPLGRLRLASILCLSMFYPVAFGLALAVGILHKPAPHGVWDTYPAIWYQNLSLVLGSERFGYTVARDLIALVLIPLVALKGRERRFVLSLSLVLFVLVTNPIAAPAWMKLLYRASYWRLAFLFPLPLCVGLVPPALSRLRNHGLGPRFAAGCAVALFLAMTVAGFRSAANLPFGDNFRRPWEMQFELEELEFSRVIGPKIPGNQVMAPESIVCVLAMLRPELRFESSRSVNDPMKFGEVGLDAEGQKRVDAQRFTNGDVDPNTWRAFCAALNDGVDTVVLVQRPASELAALLKRLPGWRVAFEDQRYILMLKDRPTVEAGRSPS
jgi:hypothetical protein